jgi:hypothetical protein
MRFEIFLVLGGIAMGFMLPSLLRARNAQRANQGAGGNYLKTDE